MHAGDFTTAMIAVGFGIYMVVQGSSAEYLIDESEGVASEEERQAAKATPLTRTICVVAGLAAVGYGVYSLSVRLFR